MKNFKLKKLVAFALVAMTIATVSPVGASAAWKQDSNGWWNTEGNSYSKGWRDINDTWYYFGSDGYMKTGWVNDGGKWYFLEASGAMKTGTVDIDGKVYCLAPSGAMQTGNVIINGVEYTFAASGEAVGDKTPTPVVTFTPDGVVVTPNKAKETTEDSSNVNGGNSSNAGGSSSGNDDNSSSENGGSSSKGNSGTSHAAISQAIIDAQYTKETKIDASVVKNDDGTTTIKPILNFTPGTYTESITAAGKKYSVTKDIFVTFNGMDAYISGNYKDGYTIDAGVTGKVEISASISVYDSENGKLYYASPKNVETVEISAN
jgi:hypothetical protein